MYIIHAQAPYNTLVYSLTNNQFGNQALTLEYFDINQSSGFIYVKKSLTLTPVNQFVVCINKRIGLSKV